MRLTFAAHVLKGGHEVIAELRDQSGSARTRMRQAPDAERVDRIRGAVWSVTLRQARTALWRPSRHGGLTPHPMQAAGKGLVMKKILSLAFVAMLSLALAALFVA
jgi:hypothetical protein